MEIEKPNKIVIWAGRIFDLAKVIIFFAMALYLVHLFVVTIFVVQGASMEPNYYQGEYLLTDRSDYNFSAPKRGEVIVFQFPGELKEKYIKRVIGLPGETIELKNNKIYANAKLIDEPYLKKWIKTEPQISQTKWDLKENEYFVLGDNRENSNDSRTWGPLPEKYFVGKIISMVFPSLSRQGKIFWESY